MRPLALAAALVFAAAPASAQSPDAADPPGSMSADSSSVADSRSAPPSAGGPGPPVAPPALEPRPMVYVSPATGLRLTLPPDWAGPVAVDESRLPGYTAYTFANAAGVTLRIERIVGLNPLERRRWRLGQAAYGYHGLRPTAPAAAPLPGSAFELAGDRTGGAVVFAQRGETFWTLHLQAPTSVWAARRADALAALVGVDLP